MYDIEEVPADTTEVWETSINNESRGEKIIIRMRSER